MKWINTMNKMGLSSNKIKLDSPNETLQALENLFEEKQTLTKIENNKIEASIKENTRYIPTVHINDDPPIHAPPVKNVTKEDIKIPISNVHNTPNADSCKVKVNTLKIVQINVKIASIDDRW